MNARSSSWLDRLLGAAISLVVSALLIHWAWDLIRPLLPVLAVVGLVAAATGIVFRYWHNRYW